MRIVIIHEMQRVVLYVTVTDRNSLRGQSYPRRCELQALLAREAVPVKDPVLRVTRGLDGNP